MSTQGSPGTVVGGHGPRDRLALRVNRRVLGRYEPVEDLLDLRRQGGGHTRNLARCEIRRRRNPGPREEHTWRAVDHAHLRKDGFDFAGAGSSDRLLCGSERQQFLEVLDCWKHEQHLARGVALQRVARRKPVDLDDLREVGLGSAMGRGEREVEAGVVTDFDLTRRDPARRVRARPTLPAPPRSLPRARGARPRDKSSLGSAWGSESTAPPGKDPDVRHEARLRGPLSEQHLESARNVLAPPARRITEAAGRGLVGWPGLRVSMWSDTCGGTWQTIRPGSRRAEGSDRGDSTEIHLHLLRVHLRPRSMATPTAASRPDGIRGDSGRLVLPGVRGSEGGFELLED